MKISHAMNYSRFVLAYLAGRETARHLPLDINVELTNVCNFACSFCPQSDPNHLERMGRNYLSLEQAQYILEQIRDLGYTRSLIHWTHDGEPFMNKHFGEIFRLARDYGFTNQYFATNALLLTEKNIRKLPEDVKFTFTIDFCADKQYFESIRGSAKSWERIRQNITRIINDPKLTHITCILSDISTFNVTDPAELSRRHNELKALFPSSGRLRFHSKGFHNAAGFFSMTKKSTHYHVCPYPFSSLSIASNGDVVACCRDLEHKSVLGNVFDTPLEQIWNGEAFRALRRNLVRKRPERNLACQGCDLPYDQEKFSLHNIVKSLFGRLQILR